MYLGAFLLVVLRYKKAIYGMAANKILCLHLTPKRLNIRVKDRIINICLLLKIVLKSGLEEVEAR